MKKSLLIIAYFFCLTGTNIIFGQVQFGLELMEDKQTYVVSMLSEQDLTFPKNRIGTAQVTLKIPTNSDFEITEVASFFDGAEWVFNSRVNAPVESSAFDYLSFGLVSLGTGSIPIKSGKAVSIFSFKNIGHCPGEVSLIDNEKDDFLYPNSEKVSIRNHLSVLGMGMKAYKGNWNQKVSCQRNEDDPAPEEAYGISTIHPNPAKDLIELNYFNADGNAFDIQIFDITGRAVVQQKIDGGNSRGIQSIDINHLNKGTYFIYLIKETEESTPFKFIKL